MSIKGSIRYWKQRIEKFGLNPENLELAIQHLSHAFALLAVSRIPAHSDRPPQVVEGSCGHLERDYWSAQEHHAIADRKPASASKEATRQFKGRRKDSFLIAGSCAIACLDLSKLLKNPACDALLKMCDSHDGKKLSCIYMIVAIDSYATKDEKMKLILISCDMCNECEFQPIYHVWRCQISRHTWSCQRTKWNLSSCEIRNDLMLELV